MAQFVRILAAIAAALAAAQATLLPTPGVDIPQWVFIALAVSLAVLSALAAGLRETPTEV